LFDTELLNIHTDTAEERIWQNKYYMAQVFHLKTSAGTYK